MHCARVTSVQKKLCGLIYKRMIARNVLSSLIKYFVRLFISLLYYSVNKQYKKVLIKSIKLDDKYCNADFSLWDTTAAVFRT